MTPSAPHVAVFSIPAAGHVNPTLAIVAELVRRGHRVSYATNEEFAPRVAAAGATPVVCATSLPSARRGEKFPLDDPIAMSDLFLEESISALPGQLAAFEDDRPDLILYDYAAFGAQILAQRWGVPAVRTSPTHVSGPGYMDELEAFYPFLEDDPAWTAHRQKFQDFLDAGGIDVPIDEVIYRGRADGYLATVPREIQKDLDQLDDRYTFVGPCLDERDFQGNWERPDNGLPVLLVAFGSVYNHQPDFYRMCVEAFGDAGWHVVLAVGDQVGRDDLGPLPETFETHASVPQLQVLSQASAFITHAGMGSTLEGLYFGVPMVAIPQAYDQLDNARIISELGLGLSIPPDQVTAERLRSAVTALTSDPAVAGRLAEVKRSVRGAGGAGAAADLIEKCLPAGHVAV
ncbi:macrolide family glycosyltransferase [Streptomyces sp. H39-S7]|uniref:macrolide family glycosyltransferase n=1 Tax=Streptomyces sp. H39-S7 TaxID=3004357 RepID=UPI0022B0187F|nr:macrolide family glycosyltransferase [Streptomyces sp. H39-S7]MCZ4125421.1 glycosyltransferase [Streptomyces sp. H39-S7]